jgi:hypothetical protein
MGLAYPVVVFFVFLAFSLWYLCFYTAYVLPSLNEDWAGRPTKQVTRYLDTEEHAGRKRWYFGIMRRGEAIQMALVILWLASPFFT